MNRYLFQMFIIFLSLIIILNVYSILKTNRKEKRISDFSLSKKDFDNTTFLEKLSFVLWNIVHRLSVGLARNKILLKRASIYEKYILIKEENYKSPIDYITVKLITIILFLLMYFILILIDVLPFNLLILILFIVIAAILPDLIWQISYARKCESIAGKLYEAIIVIDDNLSKSNIYNTINKVIKELDDDIADEFAKISIDLSYNISLFQAFKRFYERTKIKEINIIYHMLNTGNDDIETSFHQIRKEFDYINAIKNNKVTTNVVLDILKIVYILIPIVLVITMYFINPSYIKGTLTSSLGILIMEIIFTIYVLYILIIKHIVEVKR